ncbi:hypothetical protein Tco_0991500 [Tanacetum coccineum]|uniref:Uncharacterized protein n=1 Tax=Tanacetum coccineum TaxID=301880 RepID=A0ABQ5EZF9_9ASTR
MRTTEDLIDFGEAVTNICQRVNWILRISGALYIKDCLCDAGLAKKQRLSYLGKKVKAMPKSAWTEKDQTDNFLIERRLMRSLEMYVGRRLYEGDLRQL